MLVKCSPWTKGCLECCSNSQQTHLNFSLSFPLEAYLLVMFPLNCCLPKIFARGPWSRLYIMYVDAKTFSHSLTSMEQVQFHDYIGENVGVLIRDTATVADATKSHGIPRSEFLFWRSSNSSSVSLKVVDLVNLQATTWPILLKLIKNLLNCIINVVPVSLTNSTLGLLKKSMVAG